jgi:translation initiation factor IF-1
LSRDDLIQLEGVVTKILGYGTMEIECDDNIIVSCAKISEVQQISEKSPKDRKEK